LIRKLQVTDYRMIGGNAAGDAVQKGFIAQEVREIMPEAVTESRNSLIPNINAPATNVTYDSVSKTLRIILEKAHGLQQGDTVQLQGDKRSLEVKVSETINATTFIAGPVEAPISEVFVHGKKVDDFLSVDYKRIFTAGIGAIQHLAGQVDAIKAESAVRPARITDGERRFAELEASDQTCNARLDAIENMLNSSGGAVVTAAAENKQGAN
jgi:ASC-1-like (ASCH) protein